MNADADPRVRPSQVRSGPVSTAFLQLMSKYGASTRLLTKVGGLPATLADRLPERCPVCDSVLAGAAPYKPEMGPLAVVPSFCLEVGPPSEGTYPWRLSIVGVNFRPAASTEPIFSEREVDYRYLLCGGGHIFSHSTPLFGTHTRQRMQVWNTVAAIGAPASGKTYLLLRMFHQSLGNPGNWDSDDTDQIRLLRLDPLEQVPLVTGSDQYEETLAGGLAILPTDGVSGTPVRILDAVLPDALDAIRAMIRRTVVGGERRAASWGRLHRQPLVLKTKHRGLWAWTGIVDLPGERFVSEEPGRDTARLGSYQALIWVVDPAVSEAVDRIVADGVGDRFSDVLEGSLRPGSTAAATADVVRAKRAMMEATIGRRLALADGPYTAAARTSVPRLLIAVTKCDLVHAALQQRRRTLLDLGDPDTVRRGAVGYLNFLCRRWAQQRLDVDEPSGDLLGYLDGGDTDAVSARHSRLLRVADGLLRHYSDAEAFWNLAHVGHADQVVIPPDSLAIPLGGKAEHGHRWRQIDVPDIGHHIDEALRPAPDGRLLLRDLVMSAVACGVAYGLGHEQALYAVLHDPAQQPRFFLCAPLATAPVSTDNIHLAPLQPDARFPQLHDRSAGLTQLLLAVLEPARHSEPARPR